MKFYKLIKHLIHQKENKFINFIMKFIHFFMLYLFLYLFLICLIFIA